MGNNQTNQRSEQYNVEDTADDEPVIIRYVRVCAVGPHSSDGSRGGAPQVLGQK